MSRALELSDEEYTRLEQAARQRGSTIDELVRSWIDGMSAFPSDQKVREAQARWAALGDPSCSQLWTSCARIHFCAWPVSSAVARRDWQTSTTRSSRKKR